MDVVNILDHPEDNIDNQEYITNIEKKTFDSSIKQGISILQINIRSINHNFDELCVFLQKFSDKDLIYDVIILSETWEINDKSYFNLKGYQSFYNESNKNQNDGMIIYVRNYLGANVEVIHTHNFKFINIMFNKNKISFSINTVYRSPSDSLEELQNFLNSLNEILKNKNKDIEVFAGDTNINITNISDHNVTEYLNILTSHGYTQYLTKPTRIQGNSQTCIDHFFVKNKKSSKIKFCTFEEKITDHLPVSCHIIKENTNTIFVQIPKKIVLVDNTKLLTVLQNKNWQEVYWTQDPDYAYTIFETSLNQIINDSSYVKFRNKSNKKIKPWITAGLVTAINIRNNLSKKLHKDQNNQELKIRYSLYKTTITNLIKKCKDNYFKDKINLANGDLAKVWQVTREMTGDTKEQIPILEIMDNNKTTILKDEFEVASTLNNFFSEVGQNLANNINHQGKEYINKPEINNPKTLYLTPICIEEIKIFINQTKNSSSPGPDKITNQILKNIANQIAPILTHIFNRCIEKGIFPTQLKKINNSTNI